MTLDLGCGRNKRTGALGVDSNRDTAADVIADIDRGVLPFRDGSFDRVLLVHVIEHVENVISTIEEVHRVARPGGTILIETPHYTDFSSFCDPTHRWHLNTFSFRYFSEDHGGFGYYSAPPFAREEDRGQAAAAVATARFRVCGFGYYSARRLREKKIEVKLLRLWRLLGFEFAVNRSFVFRKFWEHYLCFVIRGKAVVFEFEVLKA